MGEGAGRPREPLERTTRQLHVLLRRPSVVYKNLRTHDHHFLESHLRGLGGRPTYLPTPGVVNQCKQTDGGYASISRWRSFHV